MDRTPCSAARRAVYDLAPMAMSREEMDALVDAHFGFEAADDVDGVLGTLADDAEHEVIPSPLGAIRDPDLHRSYYQLLFASIQGERVEPLRRYYGEGFLVDETLWHGTVVDGEPFLCPGRSGKVSFRLLHVFELDDGKIRREQVWCDLAAIQRQLVGGEGD
jgi:ketosteroid isomerase-like protein